MNGIELLVEEHKNIVLFTELLKKISCDILEGNEVDIKKLRECVDFGRNYADKHHHGKEEKILFRIMLEKLGPLADKLIRSGMNVEHDLGRYFTGELVKALDLYEKEPTTQVKLAIITNASAYADLLIRHAGKEDEVVFTFAARTLSEEDKKQVDEESELFEEAARKLGTQDKYVKWINQ